MTDRISLLISAKNLTAAQFADEIGVQRSSISHLMSGRNKPSLDLIQKTLQRFPEIRTEWLLFGKGEMVREMNLFDSNARSAGIQSNGRLASDDNTKYQNRESEPTLFTAETHETDSKGEIPSDNNMADTIDPAKERLAMPAPDLAENIKNIAVRKESLEDSMLPINKKSNKNECAIEKIIVFYNDRTFIAYSPGD